MSDGDIHICGDYKIGVNHKVFFDSYSIPNVEGTIHALDGMSVLINMDLKTACPKIPIKNNFKEVTMINSP